MNSRDVTLFSSAAVFGAVASAVAVCLFSNFRNPKYRCSQNGAVEQKSSRQSPFDPAKRKGITVVDSRRKAPDASQSPRKRRKKSSAKEAGEESTDDEEGEEAMEEKDVAREEIKGSADMDTKEAVDGEDVDGEAVTEESIPKKPDTKNAEMKTENEEPSAVGTENDANTVVEGAEIEESKEGSNTDEIQDGKISVLG
ncbi:hypothetical protein OROMI_007847 [Orobanche minor]